MRTLFAVLILLPVLLGATPAQQDKTPAKTAPCRVSGRVVSAVDGAPLKSSRVALVQESVKRRPQVFAATTDSDGHFEIKNVTAGRFEFFAQHAGYVDQRFKAKGDGEGAVLALQPGEEITDVLFRLIRAGVITGRIVDENGEPIAGAELSAMRKPTSEESDDEDAHHSHKERLYPETERSTDDRGEYRLFGLKPGEYYVKASMSRDGMYRFVADDFFLQQALGNEYVPLYYPGVVAFDQAQTVAVRAGDEIAADFTMRHVLAVEVAGKVIGADGKPVLNGSVRLEAVQGDVSLAQDYSAILDKGEFSIKNVPPGSYMVVASQYDEGKFRDTRQKIEVGERKINSLVLALGQGTTIHGRMTFAGPGSPPASKGGHISLSPVDENSGGPGTFARIEKDGSFELLDVADGSYTLHVNAPEPGWYMKSARFGPDDALEKGVQIDAGGADARLDIMMSSATAKLQGSVIQGDKPAVGIHVHIHPDPETPYNEFRRSGAMTDQNGHFSITDLAPGKYRVSAKTATEPGLPAPKSEAQTITLHDGDRQSLQLTLVEPKDNKESGAP